MIFCFWNISQVHSADVDFDDIFVGTSPICLMEALHRYYQGHRVLILEQDDRCGGAWRSVNVCGIPNVDLGCHFIGVQPMLADFLQKYIGCPLIDLSNPLREGGIIINNPNREKLGFYFPRGSIDLIESLLRLIEKTNIVLLLNHKLESIFIDEEQKLVRVKVKDGYYTASKVVATPYSSLQIENIGLEVKETRLTKRKYYHLYLLIADSFPFRFTYHKGIAPGMTRVMNLTPFVGLYGTGHQLIVIETGTENQLNQAEEWLQHLKERKLIGSDAYILNQQRIIYEHAHFNFASILRVLPIAKDFIEVLDTSAFTSASKYLSRWCENMQPLQPAQTCAGG